MLRMACRPQAISSVRAIGVRKKHQANTTITHVRSHTGLRDKASLGNSAADHLANWQVRHQTEGDHVNGEAHEAHNMANELPYCLAISSWSAPNSDGEQTETIRVAHGDVRRAIRDLLHTLRVEEWKTRRVRGALARDSWTDTKNVINRTWGSAPSSSDIQCIMRCLNSVSQKEMIAGEWVTAACDRCGTGHPCTAMGDLQCPANEDVWNDLDDELATKHLFIKDDDDDRAPTDLVQATETVHHAVRAMGCNLPTDSILKVRLPVAGGQPSVTLDSFREIRPVAALYILAGARKDQDLTPEYNDSPSDGEGDEPIPSPGPMVPPTLLQDVPTLSSYIAEISVGERWGPERWQCEWLRMVSRRFLRTYSDLHTHPLNSDGLWATRWRSDNPAASMLGAVVADTETFMRNSYTWSCLGQECNEGFELTTAVSAVAASTGRARVVLLVRDSASTRGAVARVTSQLQSGAKRKTRVHVHTLVRIGQGLVDMVSMHNRQGRPCRKKNTDPLSLVVVSSHDAPGIDVAGLSQVMGTTGTVDPPPWGGDALPGDEPDSNQLGKPRYNPLLRPSLCWYRNDVPAVRRQVDDPPPDHPTCTMNRALGALGAVPRTVLHDAKSTTVPDRPFVTTETRKIEISKIVLRYAQEAHRRAENWRKWRKK